MRLRPYLPGEESKLWELAQGLDQPGLHVEQDPSQWAQQLRANEPFVVEYGNQVIGYACLEREGRIEHFYVRECWQGRGVGTLLMHQVHQQAEQQGTGFLSAFVCDAAIAFFEHWGFAIAPSRHDECPQGRVLMRKAIA